MFFFSSRRRHTRLQGDWSSDVCSSDLERKIIAVKKNTFDILEQEGTAAVEPIQVSFTDADLAGAPQETIQIGRASCRERVYSSAEGGVLIKEVWNKNVI